LRKKRFHDVRDVFVASQRGIGAVSIAA
jgi:vancomycin permeability regulator SanA